MRALLAMLCAAAILTSAGCPNPDDVPPGTGGGSDRATPTSQTDAGGGEEAKASGGEESAKTEARPGKEDTPGKVARPPRSTDAAHVKVGQKYHFQTKQPQMTIDEVWEVTAVTETEVRYELTSVTRMAPMEGVPESEPIQNGPTPKVFLLEREDAPPAPGDPPKLTGTQSVEVDGVTFECQVFEGEGTRQLISKRFPRLIRMEKNDRPFKQLVKIEE